MALTLRHAIARWLGLDRWTEPLVGFGRTTRFLLSDREDM